MIISDLSYLEVVSETSSLIGGTRGDRPQRLPRDPSMTQDCSTTIGAVGGNVNVSGNGAIGGACTQGAPLNSSVSVPV